MTRNGVKRRTRETDELDWRVHILPRFGKRPVNSITTAELSEWAGRLVEEGRSAATAKRSLATFRSILGHAIADKRSSVTSQLWLYLADGTAWKAGPSPRTRSSV